MVPHVCSCYSPAVLLPLALDWNPLRCFLTPPKTGAWNLTVAHLQDEDGDGEGDANTGRQPGRAGRALGAQYEVDDCQEHLHRRGLRNPRATAPAQTPATNGNPAAQEKV